VTEALPVAATALIPLVAFPLLGVADVKETAVPYANPLVFLFLGGFVIALTMERWGLHERIALMVLARAGDRMDHLAAGFMAAAAGLSMWVSNTATTLMMLPIVLSVIGLFHAQVADTEGATAGHRFDAALLLSVAYGASVGGLATLVGTPPNAFLAGFMLETYGLTIGFGQWLALGLPLAVVMLLLTWWLLTSVVFRLRGRRIPGAAELIAGRAGKLGPISTGEKRIAVLFCITALAWVTRPWIAGVMPGMTIDDTVIAMAAAVAAFIIPVNLKKRVFLMDWATARQLPFGVLILFGGGLTLASAIAGTGLAGWIGDRLSVFTGLPVIALVVMVIAIIIFLTELTSNTATTAAFLPVVAALALTLGENPLILAVPAALAASCAFMLPVATPPNAIIFGSGHLKVTEMARAGILLNLAGVVVITLITYSLLLVLFGVEPGVLPPWAPKSG
jgi:sodium-dependent dicarboxylate transporter 2/3/5